MTGGNYVYKLLLPGRFQVRTPWGTTTLDGLNIWQDGTPPPGAPVPSEISALARRNLTHDFVLKAVTFLLRAPDGLKVSITNLGPTAADGLDGQALLLTDPNGIEVTLFFAPDDGHLLGYAADGSVQRTGQPPVRVRTVWRLVEYREVEGVRFPFRLESRSRDRASGGSSSSGAVNVTEVLSIEINTVTAADFKQGETNGVGVRR